MMNKLITRVFPVLVAILIVGVVSGCETSLHLLTASLLTLLINRVSSNDKQTNQFNTLEGGAS